MWEYINNCEGALMARFYVEKAADEVGEHLVHREGCACLPGPFQRVAVGNFHSTREAMVAARDQYAELIACASCSPELQFLETNMAFAMAELAVAASYPKAS